LTCTQAPTTPGDLTTGLWTLSSVSGEDEITTSFALSAYDAVSVIGRRNLEFTIATPAVGDPDAGDSFEIAMAGLYRFGTVTAAGTYTGAYDTTYIVVCLTGGHEDDVDVARPIFTVTTTTGVDVSGPITWDGVNPISVGNYGVTCNWTWATSLGGEGQVCKGDRFYIDVTKAGDGAIRTAVLANNLDHAVVADSDDLYVDLFIRKNVELEQNRAGHAPDTNFDQTATTITVKSGPYTTDSTWGAGVTELPIMKGDLYVRYRGLSQEYADNVHTITDIADVETMLGTVSLDNPLAYGVYNSLLNSGGVEVKFTAVATDDYTGYAGVIDLISDREDVYSLVPLTNDQLTLTMIEGHIDSASSAEIGRWRIAWVSSVCPTEETIVDEDDEGGVPLAQIKENPADPGKWTYVELATATKSKLNLLDSGIKAGDEYRTDYLNDGFGNWTYKTFTIDAVLSEDTLRLIAGPAGTEVWLGVDIKFEIWHPMSHQDQAEYMATKAGTYANRRVRLVYAPSGALASTDIPDKYTACMMAGLRSSMMPHQGLTNVEFNGLDYINTSYYTKTQLDLMAGNGVWLIGQEPITSAGQAGRVFVRHQLTTNNTDVNRQEDSVTTNVDAMSFGFRDLFRPYIGRINITPDTLSKIRSLCDAQLSYYKSQGIGTELGAMLIDGEITNVQEHATLVDRVVVQINLDVPYPLNGLEIYLVV